MKSSTPAQLPNSRSAIAAALVSFSMTNGSRQEFRRRSRRAARRASRDSDRRSVGRSGRSAPARRCPIARCGTAPSRWPSFAIAAASDCDRRARIFGARPRFAVDDRGRRDRRRRRRCGPARAARRRRCRPSAGSRARPPAARAAAPSAAALDRATRPASTSCEVTAETVALSRPVSTASSRCELPGWRRSACIRSTALTRRTQAELTPRPARPRLRHADRARRSSGALDGHGRAKIASN